MFNTYKPTERESKFRVAVQKACRIERTRLPKSSYTTILKPHPKLTLIVIKALISGGIGSKF